MHRVHHLLPLLLLAAAPAAAQQRIAVGETARGELSASDPEDHEGRHVDTWLFQARGGVTYAITLEAQHFDGYLWAGPQFEGGIHCRPCSEDDDGFGMPDPRIILTAERAGTYVVRAGSYNEGETGEYTLKVREYAGPAVADPLAGVSTDTVVAYTTTAVPPPEPAAEDAERPVPEAGGLTRGRLEEGDRATEGEAAYVDVWRIQGEPGHTFTITMSSDELDTTLRVGRWMLGEWQELAADDDGAGGTDSRVTITVHDADQYEIHAGALNRGQEGAYLLEVVRTRPEGDTVPATPPADIVPVGPSDPPLVVPFEGDIPPTTLSPADLPFISPGGMKEGALQEGDPAHRNGSLYDRYTYFGGAGETVTFSLASDHFDAVLRVGTRDETGRWRELASDDDGGSGTDSEVTITFPEQAAYEVHAGAYEAGQSGAYTLFSRTDAHDDVTARLPPTTVVPGQTVTGTLDEMDDRGDGGEFVDVWDTLGGAAVTIDLRSQDFDPLLRVMARRADGTWEEIARDDDGGVGMDSRLTITLPEGGVRIHVTTYRPGDRGAYTLAVHR